MAVEDRNDVIDAYFEALDQANPDIVQETLADDFVYQSPGGEFEGGEGIRQYIEEVRTMSNSTHEISLRLHDEQASVAEGRVTGDTADGEPVQVRFADVFEFDEDDAKLTRCAVYLNDA